MGPLFTQVEGVLFFKESNFIKSPKNAIGLYLCHSMGRIMGIDFGLKRTGVSVTDPLRIIVKGLETQPTEQLMSFILAYSKSEIVDAFVVGYPFLDGNWGNKNFREKLDNFILELKKAFPFNSVELHDERYTSIQAREIIHQRGLKKAKREDKALLDQTSAILILQEYLGHI